MYRNRYITLQSMRAWWFFPGRFCLAAYQPKGAASLVLSYQNLARPGINDATPAAAPPDWDSSAGWIFNGSTQFLSTGLTPVWSYTLAVRFSDVLSSAVGYLGGYYTTAADGYALFPLYMSSFIFANNNDGQIAPGAAAGVMAMAGKKGYFDGKKVIDIAGTTNAISGSINIAGGQPGRYRACKIQAFAVYADTLSEAQMAELTRRMQSL